ncbi:MAG: L-threonylcarbamoyladenylate synthase [Thermonemataceae bacterium]|nr:L-threonylcarbamoyladenylate synthase [Thermonemataceae bacterium]
MINQDIFRAATLLRQGELVAIPTETVYGLAANAFDVEAVAKIFAAKNRPFFDPLIVHTDSIEKIKSFVADFPPKAELLAQNFWAGALTLLLPKTKLIPDLVTAGLPRVAVRIPKHPLTLALLRNLDFPLAAPSANPFGYISPTKAEHVAAQLSEKVALILEGGECEIGLESTIVGFEGDKTVIYRLGGISVEEIERIVGSVEVKKHSSSNPAASGMLESHYAPRKKMFLQTIETLLEHYKAEEIAVLAFNTIQNKIPLANQKILSPQGDYLEAAKNLFDFMRILDEMPQKVIWAELLPEKSLGRAINDRLKRAATEKL